MRRSFCAASCLKVNVVHFTILLCPFFGQVWRGSASRNHLLLIQTSFIALDPDACWILMTVKQQGKHASGSRAQVCVGGVFSLQKYSPRPACLTTYAIEFTSSLQAPLFAFSLIDIIFCHNEKSLFQKQSHREIRLS